LVEKSKKLGLNLSKTFENHLKQLITGYSAFSMQNNINLSKYEGNLVGPEEFESSSIAPTGGGNSDNGGDLLVLSMEYGIKSYVYLAFDLSNFPQDKTAGIAILELESNAVDTRCYVSAYYSTGSDWVNQNITWDTKPTISTLVNSLYITTMSEWYDYTGTSFMHAVDQACQQKGTITLCLKVGTPTLDQYGFITFLSNVHLDVYYAPETSTISSPTPTLNPTLNPTSIPTSQPTSTPIQKTNPTPTIPEFSSIAIISVLAIGVLVTATAYKKMIKK
jgi:hypothetical protein